MAEHAVIVVGGGPTGMMLAAELALAKVDVAVVERRPDSVLIGSRARGFHSRTIEVLDQRGIADRFLAAGKTAQTAVIGTTVLDISDFPTRHPYGLGISQNQVEQIIAGWVAELPVQVYYGHEATGFRQDDTGVDVELFDGTVPAGEVSRRVRRRTEHHPERCWHRLPGVGCDKKQPDRRG